MKRHLIVLGILEIILGIGSFFLLKDYKTTDILRIYGNLFVNVTVIYSLIFTVRENVKGNKKVSMWLLFLFTISFVTLTTITSFELKGRGISITIPLVVGVMFYLSGLWSIWKMTQKNTHRSQIGDGSLRLVEESPETVRQSTEEDEQSAVHANAGDEHIGRAGIASRLNRQRVTDSQGNVHIDRTTFGTTVTTPDGRQIDAADLARRALLQAETDSVQARVAEVNQLLQLADRFPNARKNYLEQVATLTGVSINELMEIVQEQNPTNTIEQLVAANLAWRSSRRRKT